MTRHLITSALPYINGVKHLGNLVGSMLPADVYARYLRQQGSEVLFICGTDEHGTPAELAAEAAGLSVQDYCDSMFALQRDIYERFAISFDHFGRSSSPSNHETTRDIFDALDRNGMIEARSEKHVYSIAERRFLPDRYVVGICPACGYERARGDQCDRCGSLLEPQSLIEPRSALDPSSKIELRTSDHLYLRLDLLQPDVQSWVDRHSWSPTVGGIARKWLGEGLAPRAITRDLHWGIAVPKPGFENKVFYVWFDAPNAYIAITKDWAASIGRPEAWREWWQHSEDVEYSQFMAKDNVPFHIVMWPAMLLGSKLKIKLVDHIKGTGWLTYDSGKFSTSEKRGVFTDRALEIFPADYWRYCLLAISPDTNDSDFSFATAASILNKDLADILGNFVNRVTALIDRNFPDGLPAGFTPDRVLLGECRNRIDKIGEAVRLHRMRQAVAALRALWILANEYVATSKPWSLVKEDRAGAVDVLKNCLLLLRAIAATSAPIIPAIAVKIGAVIELREPNDIKWADALDRTWLDGEVRISAIPPLFTKITDAEVKALDQEFAGRH